MADEREQQIRERLEATKRHFQSNGFGLSREDYAQWIKDGAAAFALHRDGADDLAYLLDALAAAREELERLKAPATDGELEEYADLAVECRSLREENARLREALIDTDDTLCEIASGNQGSFTPRRGTVSMAHLAIGRLRVALPLKDRAALAREATDA